MSEKFIQVFHNRKTQMNFLVNPVVEGFMSQKSKAVFNNWSPSAKLPDATCLWHCFCIFFLSSGTDWEPLTSIKSSVNSFVVFISSWISPTSISWNTLPTSPPFLSYLQFFMIFFIGSVVNHVKSCTTSWTSSPTGL